MIFLTLRNITDNFPPDWYYFKIKAMLLTSEMTTNNLRLFPSIYLVAM